MFAKHLGPIVAVVVSFNVQKIRSLGEKYRAGHACSFPPPRPFCKMRHEAKYKEGKETKDFHRTVLLFQRCFTHEKLSKQIGNPRFGMNCKRF